ncbi:hypothetical protein CGLO_04053 [Colletotrichum gloeosporioides Cg-14]|uniref:GPI inositol-deacylase winged helix domain-containing protein n=1 Tax=Colletotrichum gloeosporioides (strain Cg-14) TaxID=1237896 RepID=T0KKA2_COLGC|nr:hypothetical protein CGLO_04053 [Colletotrichum gloeosporioides Cg-14]
MKEIAEKLQIGGEGMFLWVFLTIEDICSCPTDDDIRQTLEILPRKLSDTFNRAIGRILSSQRPSIVDIVQRAFRWVATVRRPLTRWELGEALGVKVLQKSSIKGQIVNGTERIPGWCENLVQIEAGDETVRFFHHSIKTHLLSTELNATELRVFHIDVKAWDHQVGEVCLTYLNFSDFERALTETEFSPSPGPDKLLGKRFATSNEGRSIPVAVRNQAALNVLPHTGRLSAARFLRRFLKARKSGESFHVPKGASKSENVSENSEIFSDYPFLLYASNFWFHHTFHFHQSTTKTWRLWKDQVTTSILEDEECWPNFGQLPPSFHDDTFDLNIWRSNSSIWDLDRSELKVSENKRRDAERIMFHKAIVFADFIAHRALLSHVLTTMKDRGHNHLSLDVLELLLPTRRVFQSPLEYEGYIRKENSHDGLISLIAEFIAWGGTLWPRIPSLELQSPCNETCTQKPTHALLVKTLSKSGYSKDDDPWLQLLAKMAILKLTKETAEAIEMWIKSGNPCIHALPIPGCTDIVHYIFKIGGPSSTKFAQWVSSLHENCVSISCKLEPQD